MENQLATLKTKTPLEFVKRVENFLAETFDQKDRAALARFLASKMNSENTFHAYRRDLGEFLTLMGMKPLEEITRYDVSEYELSIGHYAPATQNRKKSVVREFFSFCDRKLEYLRAETASHIENTKIPDQLQQRVLSESETASLINAGKNDSHQLILDLTYRSGIRVTELISLKWADLTPAANSPDGILHIREGKGRKARSIRIDPYTYQDLAAMRNGAPDNAPIFATKSGKPLHRTQVNRIVNYARRDAGIGKKVSPHWLRHACASHGLDNGVSLATMRDQLGHENISTTSRYTHGKPEDSAALHLPHLRRKKRT